MERNVSPEAGSKVFSKAFISTVQTQVARRKEAMSAIHKGHDQLSLFLSHCLVGEVQTVAVSFLKVTNVSETLCEQTKITISLLSSVALHDND